MPTKKRHRTKYSGVYYTEGRSPEIRKKERIYYIIYRKNGRQVEERVGRQFQDAMTPAKAAKIRAECMAGKRLSRKGVEEVRRPENEPGKTIKNQALEEQFAGYKLLKEKWFLFTKSATESFSLWDSELNVVEINDATLKLLPEGTEKKDIIGKSFSELSPDSVVDGAYENFARVLKTGEPLFINDFVPPPRFGEDIHLKLKAFKVGDELGIILADITDRTRAERELRKREAELEGRTRDLEEMNTALNVLLQKREKDKLELEETIARNITELVEPYVEKMKNSRLDSSQRMYADIIEKNLNDIASPFIRKVTADFLTLTPAEIQISNLIKHGKTTKEIGELLNLSPRTIDSYREQIRSKLGLKNKKVNLRTYLMSIQ